MIVAAKWPRLDTMYCGGIPPGVAFELPPRRPLDAPGLSDPSGSCLRVMSHDVKCVIGRDIYSGLYLGRVSLDVAHSDALVLALFDGITTGAATVDLHFLTSSHYGSV